MCSSWSATDPKGCRRSSGTWGAADHHDACNHAAVRRLRRISDIRASMEPGAAIDNGVSWGQPASKPDANHYVPARTPRGMSVQSAGVVDAYKANPLTAAHGPASPDLCTPTHANAAGNA
jgi:hypothetical protein